MKSIEVISSLLIIAAFVIILSLMFYEKKTGIPSIPTLPWVRKKIIEALKSRFDAEKEWKFAELGCGWGGINLDLAKNFTKSDVIGFEISIFPYFLSKIRAFMTSKRIKIFNKSFFEADLSQFNVLVCYLGPSILERLKPQFANLSLGTVIISPSFPIAGWEPVEILHTYVGITIPIYVYEL